MRIVLSLFLPVQIQQEQESVESTIYTMDTMRDGEIRLRDFVKGVREAGSFKLRRSVSYLSLVMKIIVIHSDTKKK